MKSSLAILGLLLTSSSLTLAQTPTTPAPSPGTTPAPGPSCMSALMALMNDDEFEKCLPVGEILMKDQSGNAFAYIKEFKGIPDDVCDTPYCPDSLITGKVNAATNSCTNELKDLNLSVDQIDQMVLTLYKDFRQLLCYQDSHSKYCMDVAADSLDDYVDNNQVPPANVLCTPCIKAIFSKSREMLALIAKSPIGVALNMDPDKILPAAPLKNVCGASFVDGTIPDTTAGNGTSGGNSTTGGGGSGSGGSGGSSGGSGTSGTGGSGSGSGGNSTSGNSSAASNTRMDYLIFSVLALFVALW